MPSSITLATVRTNLKTQLLARGNLSAVQVRAYEPGPDDIEGDEAIWFGPFDGDQEHAAMGGSRLDNGTLQVILRARKPGGGDTVAAAAEARALALLAELEAQLRTDPTINSGCMHAQLVGYDSDNEIEPGNRVCEVTARVRIETHLT